MDHPVRLDHENPWRSTALVASGVAALELLVLVVLAFAIIVKPLLTEDSPASAASAKKAAAKATTASAKTPAAAAAPAKSTHPPLARTKTRVLVLNGNGQSGAASEKAAWIMTRGYPIAATANAPRSDFARSLVMFTAGHEAEARRFGKDFNVSRVIPLDGLKRRNLQGAAVVLVIGRD
jgi:uncharacterized protein (UPF0333 family)